MQWGGGRFQGCDPLPPKFPSNPKNSENTTDPESPHNHTREWSPVRGIPSSARMSPARDADGSSVRLRIASVITDATVRIRRLAILGSLKRTEGSPPVPSRISFTEQDSQLSAVAIRSTMYGSGSDGGLPQICWHEEGLLACVIPEYPLRSGRCERLVHESQCGLAMQV